GPLLKNSHDALKRYRTRTVAQRAGAELAMMLEQHVAFLKQDDLTLQALLLELRIPDRAGALVPPRLPSYFCAVDAERRARMVDACAMPGPLQDRIKNGWIP